MPIQTTSHLGQEGIRKLLLQFSIPAIVAMAATSVYNVVDRIFIGQGVGPLAISGLALTLPFMNLAIAFGAMVGAGAATLVSIRMGQKRSDEAAKILGTTVLLNLVLSLTYSLVMLYFLDEILVLFGASSETLPFAHEFMQVILLGNLFQHSYLGLNGIMRASGYPHKSMTITLICVAINIVLAPLFIFAFHWGIRGAAFATVIAQFVGLIQTLRHFANPRHTLHFLPGHFTFNRSIIRDIFAIGLAPFFIQIGSCLVAIIINLQLVRYGGDYAVGAFGVVNSVLMLVAMIVMGLTQGMQPIVGFNYGARLFNRVRQAFKLTIYAATSIVSLGFVIGELFPHFIARAFTDSPALIEIATPGMRIALMFFPLVGFQMVASNFFQSIGHAKISIFLSLSRQVVFLIPALITLPLFFGLTGVWASLPTADFAACILTIFIVKRQMRKMERDPLPPPLELTLEPIIEEPSTN